MPQPISRFPLPDSLDALPADLRERILAVQAKAGFIPNVFLMLAHRPAEFRAFFAYHDALMERASDSLTQAEKEMIVVAVSADHGCLYCVVAHGAILRILTKDAQLADQIAVNYRTAPISERQRTMLDFALHLAAGRGVLDDPWQARLEAQASVATTSGTSAPSPRCSGCPTAWCPWRARRPTTSSTCWVACPGRSPAESEAQFSGLMRHVLTNQSSV